MREGFAFASYAVFSFLFVLIGRGGFRFWLLLVQGFHFALFYLFHILVSIALPAARTHAHTFLNNLLE